jgi:Ecdysteroid kinase-like family
MPAIPNSAAELTTEWFTDAIGDGARCTSVTTGQIAVGVGLVGQLHRCDLTWEGDGAGERPTRVIAKLAAAGAESRFVATVLNFYGRETGFYRELAGRTPVGHPHCWYERHDADTQDCVLLLEDVSLRGDQLDQIAGASLDAAEPALRTLARLHAAWWESPDFDEHPWLLRLGDEPYPSAVQFAYSNGWPVVQEFMADLITPRVKAMGDAYAEMTPAIFERLSTGPLTLSHGDWRLDNLFFTGDDDQPVIAVDWQIIDRSVGPRDVAYIVTQSLELSSTAEYTKALDLYLDELAAAGVRPDRDWALDMYRHAVRFGWVYPVVAGGSLTVEDPRHVELCRALGRRCITAMEALDAFDLPQ